MPIGKLSLPTVSWFRPTAAASVTVLPVRSMRNTEAPSLPMPRATTCTIRDSFSGRST
jgi:hypothetical protein